MGHNHNHFGDITEPSGKISGRMLATLIGGVLLICSLIAKLLFPEATPSQFIGGSFDLHAEPRNFHADTLAMFGALLLGIPLILHALEELIHGHAHMDELVALAFLASFATGSYQAAGWIAFFMTISTLIESRTAMGARASIESLIKITPTRANKITPDGEQEVEAKDLKPGEAVRVRPGDNIPGDGIITSGSSTVNQANITGESLPIDKAKGEEVFGGTINLTGALDIEITKAGADTTLGKVQELILQAERTRIPIVRLIDRYAQWYTPTILMLAGIVLFFTRDLERAISMLVISCPCALVLATPTAMVAALSAAARLGVLIKNVADLETARNLTAIVFDKTGTLTTGRLTVTRLNPAKGVDGAELLAAAAHAESGSNHPVAKAVVEVAERAQIQLKAPEHFEEAAGRGVKASLGGKQILVGRASWIQEQGQGIKVEEADEKSAEGLSLLYVTQENRFLGWIGLADQTRPGAARSIENLRELGIKHLVMVTGDRWAVANRVAADIHCTAVEAEVLPGQKLELVDQLKGKGHTVAVIGDGVNDAPALAAGDISLAMGAAGSDVAIHSASIALMNNNLNRIPFLIKLSGKLTTVIRQNLFFGIFFILLLVALSAYGLVAPIAAAALHAAGSTFVIFNSARLVREGEDLDHLPQQKPAARTPRTQPVAQPA